MQHEEQDSPPMSPREWHAFAFAMRLNFGSGLVIPFVRMVSEGRFRPHLLWIVLAAAIGLWQVRSWEPPHDAAKRIRNVASLFACLLLGITATHGGFPHAIVVGIPLLLLVAALYLSAREVRNLALTLIIGVCGVYSAQLSDLLPEATSARESEAFMSVVASLCAAGVAAVLASQYKAHVDATIAQRDAYAARLQELIAIMAHDLRSPIGTTVSCLKLHQSQAVDEPTRQQLLQDAEDCAQAALGLIGELFDFAIHTEGRVHYDVRPQSLLPVVEKACLAPRAAASAKGITLTTQVDPDLVVPIDAARIHQLLQNLLQNAIKFSESGGYIAVTARTTDSHFVLQVIDDGIGIPPELHEAIFDPSDTRARRSGTEQEASTGFGLPLCRAIADAHGGELTVQSDGASGTTMSFVLPLTRQLPTDTWPRDGVSALGSHRSRVDRRRRPRHVAPTSNEPRPPHAAEPAHPPG